MVLTRMDLPVFGISGFRVFSSADLQVFRSFWSSENTFSMFLEEDLLLLLQEEEEDLLLPESEDVSCGFRGQKKGSEKS